MADLRSFDSNDVYRLAPMGDAVAALRTCFAAGPSHIARSAHPTAGGEFMVMPAVDANASGVKLLMIQPANAGRGQPIIQGTYVLFDADAGRPVALLDGAALTNVRTPAISAVATDALARHDVASLGIVGSGPQAAGRIEAMLCVRPMLTEIIVASRTPDNTRAAAERALKDGIVPVGVTIRAGTFAEAAACDIVCAATRSSIPVLHASMLRPGSHLNAVGSYRTDIRELAGDLVAGSTVFVDDRHAALDEAGDLALAVDDGVWQWDDVAGDLSDLASGRAGRRNTDEITLFKSVGLTVEDLVIARLVAAADDLL